MRAPLMRWRWIAAALLLALAAACAGAGQVGPLSARDLGEQGHRNDAAEDEVCAVAAAQLRTFAASAAVQAPVCAWRPLRAAPRPPRFYVPNWEPAPDFTATKDYLQRFLALWFDEVHAAQHYSPAVTVPTAQEQRTGRQMERRRQAQWQRKWTALDRMYSQARLRWSEARFDIDNDDVREALLRLDVDACERDTDFDTPGLFPRIAAIDTAAADPVPLRVQRLQIGWNHEEIFAYQGVTYALAVVWLPDKPGVIQQGYQVVRLHAGNMAHGVYAKVGRGLPICGFVVTR